MTITRRQRRGRWGRWAAAGLLLAGAALAQPSGAERSLPLENAWTRIRPAVLWCSDRSSTATVEVHILGRDDVVEARIVGPNEAFSLYDDGTHGDVAAADRVFTATNVRPYCNTRYSMKYGDAVGIWYGTLEVTLDDGRRLVDPRLLCIGLVHPRYAHAFSFESYGDGLSATAYALFIEDIDCALFGGYPVASKTPKDAAQEAVRRLYTVFPDDFDVILVMPAMSMFDSSDLAEVPSLSWLVSNDVRNIGLPLCNDGAEYGSSGSLLGVIYHSFGSLDLVDVETAALYGARLGFPVGLSVEVEPGRFLWSPTSDVGGQLGAYYVSPSGDMGRFVANEDGTWRFDTSLGNVVYAPLELYAMGFLPAADVPPMHLLIDPNLDDPNRVTAAAVTTVTMEDIVAAQGGERDPASDGTPRELRVAVVVVNDEPFTAAEYAYYSLLAFELMTKSGPADFDAYAPFYWATGGRGTISVLLPVNVPAPLGS